MDSSNCKKAPLFRLISISHFSLLKLQALTHYVKNQILVLKRNFLRDELFPNLGEQLSKASRNLRKTDHFTHQKHKKAFTVIKEVGTPKMLVDPSSNLVDKIDTFRQLLVLLGM